MPQGAAGAPAWFVSVMKLVTTGLDNVRMYLDDAIGSDDCPINHVSTLATFLRAYAYTNSNFHRTNPESGLLVSIF